MKATLFDYWFNTMQFYHLSYFAILNCSEVDFGDDSGGEDVRYFKIHLIFERRYKNGSGKIYLNWF